ncbi:LysR family transcriptional regulator [Undibacterium sp. Di24W]|uniref:LysR family transcriptional regulator n=1 Tax=Undibacterium sp. Di24W TaxID=3413033 RepID=UPI003BF37F77
MVRNSNDKSLHTGLSWDDLRFVLVLTDSRVLATAAEQLQVSQTTVFRRIKDIEERLGTRLFDRGRYGYVPTSSATSLIEIARQFNDDVNRIALSIAGLDERPSGKVRLSTTDTIMAAILKEILTPLHQALPLIHLEIQSSNQVMNLSKREADVCIRPCDTPPDHLVGKRLCKMESSIYAPASWADASYDNINTFPWIGPDDSLSHLQSTQWLAKKGLLEKTIISSNNRQNIAFAASAGLGLAILPCYIGDRDENLRRVCAPIVELKTELWILYHPDLRQSKRITSFVNTLFQLLLPYQPLIEGLLPKY